MDLKTIKNDIGIYNEDIFNKIYTLIM